ncbi:MAG: LUD domain-containing protein [Lewinellaceae bacterium]|nr:LUD domain-containing protein [Lewinellaceae bacterium]
MNPSREAILARIRAHKPSPVPPPEIPAFAPAREDTVAWFQATLEAVGATWAWAEDTPLSPEWFEKHYGAGLRIVGVDPDWAITDNPVDSQTPLAELNKIDVAVIPGKLGVAENGAVWVDETCVPQRILPFITQHLILTLRANQIVGTLHQAYQQLAVAETGFSIFIAGPSKTADIEQALVKGAQGARTTLVVIKS